MQLCYLWKLFVLSSLCLVGGIERQRTALQRDEQKQEYELVHIAKTAGRNIKYQSKRLGEVALEQGSQAQRQGL